MGTDPFSSEEKGSVPIFPVRALYTALLYLLAPLVLIRLVWRGLRSPEYLHCWSERFGAIHPAVGERVIWVHAVSVGEVQAAESMIRALLDLYPEYSILMTTVTATGAAHVTELFGGEVAHVYAPYDLPDVVSRFIDRVRPRLAIVMETELWPNLFRACRQKNIPLLLVNARLSEKSLAGYRRFGRLIGKTLEAVTQIAARTPLDAERFRALGAEPDRIRVSGDLKFEQHLPAGLHERASLLRQEWGVNRHVWIAGSTHEGEDELILDVFGEIRKTIGDCLLVLVPRHTRRFAAVAALCRQRGYRSVLRSERLVCEPDTAVFIGDSMGELLMFYAAADVAFVGGSLVEAGGHNMLEPAALGIPVVTGPHVANFSAVCELLLSAGACRRVMNTAELQDTVQSWLLDANERHRVGDNGRVAVEQNRGALRTVLEMIDGCLADGEAGDEGGSKK
jgi:3-deoxy-D-manno-octulosonic-acid transferase